MGPSPEADGETLAQALASARACRLCAHAIEPRPVVRGRASARLLIVGQAPGTRVHASGIPFDDPSGDRLRAWLEIDRATFYDETRIAIIPAGLCYPGRDGRGADLAPRRECAPAWHPRLRPHFRRVALTLLVGAYGQALYLGARRQRSLTETVRAFRSYLPEFLPLPHPSWRNTGWIKRNPWFEAEVLADLRARIGALIAVDAGAAKGHINFDSH